MKTANIALESEVSRVTTGSLTEAKRKLATAGETLDTWRVRANTRLALRELSPEMLRDVGIDALEALDEANKPFWRK